MLYLTPFRHFVVLASLFHDLGKSSDYFQQKLRRGSIVKDPLRHEWVSCKILEAMVRSSGSESDDSIWMQAILHNRISERDILDEVSAMQDCHIILTAPRHIPPIMQILMWLILTHHRLPLLSTGYQKYEGNTPSTLDSLMERIDARWGYRGEGSLDACLKFSYGILFDNSSWMDEIRNVLADLLQQKDFILSYLNNHPLILRPMLLFSREALMLADYSVSANPSHEPNSVLYANTDRKGVLCESLPQHLIRTSRMAERIFQYLPHFADATAYAKPVHFTKPGAPYQWQDTAVQTLQNRQSSEDSTAYFILDMASTGRGKTTGNAKILQAFSKNGKGVRYTAALGLRSLTLQTGEEYRKRMHICKRDLAVIIGSSAAQALHDSDQEDLLLHEPLFFDDSPYRNFSFLDIFLDEKKNVCAKKNAAYLLKPILITTIDQIMGATETTRGGRGLLPFLRLLSSDLVIDEIDDFSPDDLTAIARLVHLVGMFGRNLILSSATIPPDLALGLYQAYADGLSCYNSLADKPKLLRTMWVDEFSSKISSGHFFADEHKAFVRARAERLGRQIIQRKGEILPCCPHPSKADSWHSYTDAIQRAILRMHSRHHVIDVLTQKSVSIGLLRFANVDPCVNMAIALTKADWPKNVAVYLMCYHSRQVILLRYAQEKYLDSVLKRTNQQCNLIYFRDSVIRKKLDMTDAEDVIFLVVSTPVEEIGRDHDFDWAILEPSSYHSLIQLAGRVHRHRPFPQDVQSPNIGILEYNWRGMQSCNRRSAVFRWPGFEDNGKYLLNSHDVRELIRPQALERIDAVPRITKDFPLHPKDSLLDLEHQRLEDWRASDSMGPESMLGWQRGSWWMTGLPQVFHPFRADSAQLELCCRYFSPDDCRICTRLSNGGYTGSSEYTYNISHYAVPQNVASRLWLSRDYVACLQEQVKRQGLEDNDENRKKISECFGQLMLPVYAESYTRKYWYSDQFGLFHDVLTD